MEKAENIQVQKAQNYIHVSFSGNILRADIRAKSTRILISMLSELFKFLLENKYLTARDCDDIRDSGFSRPERIRMIMKCIFELFLAALVGIAFYARQYVSASFALLALGVMIFPYERRLLQ